MEETLKIVAIGDGNVGKTSLFNTFIKNEFPENYEPTVFDNTMTTIEMQDGKSISAELWDTAGQEQFDRIRPLSYRDTNIFLICFSIMNSDSLENIGQKWIPEIQQAERQSPSASPPIYILVGTKCDLRGTSDKECSAEQIEEVRTNIGSDLYMETSAKIKINIHETFQESAALYLHATGQAAPPSGCCTIL